MVELELEKTYLAKSLPLNLASCKNELIEDIYIPGGTGNAKLRLRRRGDRYEMTKKIPADDTDSTRQHEHTISLTQDEYAALAGCSNKKVVKRRYYCRLDGHDAEVDVFQGELGGLVVIDFEFATETEMQGFNPPDICLADVSQEVFVAGGDLAGKVYQQIEEKLQQFGYKPLFIEVYAGAKEVSSEAIIGLSEND